MPASLRVTLPSSSSPTTGPYVLAVPERLAQTLGLHEYLVCINRAEGKRTKFQLYPHGLRGRLPRVRCPLAGNDRDVVLDLQAVLQRTYEAGGYQDLIRYDQDCVPPLPAEDQTWANGLIRDHSQHATSTP